MLPDGVAASREPEGSPSSGSGHAHLPSPNVIRIMEGFSAPTRREVCAYGISCHHLLPLWLRFRLAEKGVVVPNVVAVVVGERREHSENRVARIVVLRSPGHGWHVQPDRSIV